MEAELAEIRDFLARHAPFDALPTEVLDRLPAQLDVRYARRGSHIIDIGDRPEEMYVLRSGAVDIRGRDGALVERAEAGTSIGMSALLDDTTAEYEFVAIEDSLLLAVPAELFLRLCADHADARRWFDRRHQERLRRAAGLVVGERSGLGGRAVDLASRPPQTVAADRPVRAAAEQMQQAGVSSLLVVDGGRLVGILTDRDLRNRVLAAGVDPGVEVRAVMTMDPVTVPPDAPASELLMTMVERGVHHLPVVDEAHVVGMVTSTDLLRVQNADPVHLVGEARRAPDVPALVAAAGRLPDAVQRLVEEGAPADAVGRVVTAVGDMVERRLVDLALDELGPAPVPWCWVVLGSRARLEQALGADQDHALVLSDEATPDDDAWFAALAERVEAGLTACGYPPCTGGVMASRPAWRRTVSAWRESVGSWVWTPEPSAVLAGAITFDLRPLHGTASLATDLHAEIVAMASRDLFLAALGRHAVEVAPPLGFFRGFVVEQHGEHAQTVDLKRRGLNPVVDLARVHALSAGSTRVNTAARLRAAASAGLLSASLATELTEAYAVIAQARLNHHVRRLRSGHAPDAHVRPDELGPLERRHLRDAFGVVKQAQAALARSTLLSYL